MNYIEVFQLAEQKGYEFTTSWYEDSDEVDLLQLTLIQKWLRDEHKIIVLIECEAVGYLYNSAIKWKKIAYKEQYGKGAITYENALIEGINKALKLL